MGAVWLNGSTAGYPALPDVCRAAGLRTDVYPGAEWASRSSGGFEALLGVVVHHTASPPSSSFENDWNYCANGPDNPIASLLLGRDGRVGVTAMGAANHAGKGGPWSCSRGTVPLDSGNSRLLGIEAQNSGLGTEPWAPVMLDAYERLVAALCNAYGLNPQLDVMAHYEWGGPDVPHPGRKIDPFGPAGGPGYGYAAGTYWHMRGGGGFVDVVARRMTAPEPPEEDDMAGFTYKDTRYQNVWLMGQGPATSIPTPVLQGLALPKYEAAHDQTLACIVWEAWGCSSVDEARERGYLV